MLIIVKQLEELRATHLTVQATIGKAIIPCKGATFTPNLKVNITVAFGTDYPKSTGTLTRHVK